MGWFSGVYRKIIVGSWNSPQAAMTARGPGTRKAPGDDCLCGKGVICRAYSPDPRLVPRLHPVQGHRMPTCLDDRRQEKSEELEIMRRWRGAAVGSENRVPPLACADRSWSGSA